MLNPITGQLIRHNPVNHLTVEQLVERNGRSLRELIRDVLFGDQHAPALCEHGCEVEPDGSRQHECQSVMRALGVGEMI
jgi:hypothetical protein